MKLLMVTSWQNEVPKTSDKGKISINLPLTFIMVSILHLDVAKRSPQVITLCKEKDGSNFLTELFYGRNLANDALAGYRKTCN